MICLLSLLETNRIFRSENMSIIPFRNIRLLLSYCQRLRCLEQTKRCTVTVTDEYRSTARSRSSLKGVELLRNPALNKVIILEDQFKRIFHFVLILGYGFYIRRKATYGYSWSSPTCRALSRYSSPSPDD